MDKDSKDNVIHITIDTEDGVVEERVDLDSLTLDELAQLVTVVPNIKEYYGMRLVKELRD